MAKLPMKILDPRVGTMFPKPEYKTSGAAAFDLIACTDPDGITVHPMKRVMVHTGVAVEIPAGYVGLLTVRSSIGAKLGCSLANCVGVIDSDYRGELLVCLENHSESNVHIDMADRIAQVLIVPVLTPEIQIVPELSETARGTGGYGSTGKQ